MTEKKTHCDRAGNCTCATRDLRLNSCVWLYSGHAFIGTLFPCSGLFGIFLQKRFILLYLFLIPISPPLSDGLRCLLFFLRQQALHLPRNTLFARRLLCLLLHTSKFRNITVHFAFLLFLKCHFFSTLYQWCPGVGCCTLAGFVIWNGFSIKSGYHTRENTSGCCCLMNFSVFFFTVSIGLEVGMDTGPPFRYIVE